jgi:hypothetical protein
MEQHLCITGVDDAIMEEPVFGNQRLRTRPRDTDGQSWRDINKGAAAVLSPEEIARFLRCTDAFATIIQSLDSAPPVFKQLATTIETGNAKALWDAVKKHIEETRGETGARLLSKLASAQMQNGETPLQYGVRLQADLSALQAHGKDLDEDLLKDRYVNHMTPDHADTARSHPWQSWWRRRPRSVQHKHRRFPRPPATSKEASHFTTAMPPRRH